MANQDQLSPEDLAALKAAQQHLQSIGDPRASKVSAYIDTVSQPPPLTDDDIYSPHEMVVRNSLRQATGQEPPEGYPLNAAPPPALGAAMAAGSVFGAPVPALTALGVGYGTSKTAEKFGAPPWLSNTLGGLAGLSTGLAPRLLPSLLPESMSPATTDFLDIPGGIGTRVNRWLRTIHGEPVPTEVGPSIKPKAAPPVRWPQQPQPMAPPPIQYGQQASPVEPPPIRYGQQAPAQSVAPPPPIRNSTIRIGGQPVAPPGLKWSTTLGDEPVSPISPILTPSGGPQLSTIPPAPEGTITVPPIEGRPQRYNTMAVQGGGALQDMTYAKDMRIASSLKQAGIKPNDWMGWSDVDRDAYAQKLGYKAFGKGGKLGRQTHIEGAKDIFDRLTDLWGQ